MSAEAEQLKDWKLWQQAIAKAREDVRTASQKRLKDKVANEQWVILKNREIDAQNYLWKLERACQTGELYLIWKLTN